MAKLAFFIVLISGSIVKLIAVTKLTDVRLVVLKIAPYRSQLSNTEPVRSHCEKLASLSEQPANVVFGILRAVNAV